jgi:hypothetical protein
MYAQSTKAILTFKDGSVLEGLGKLKGAEKVKFRKNKKTKAAKYHFSDLESVKIFTVDEANTYVYLLDKQKNKFRVLEEVLKGKVSLYRIVSRGNHGGFGGFGTNGMTFSVSTSFSIKSFYVRKSGEDSISNLGSTSLFSKNFKKAASNYFKDCPKLVTKIQHKEYRKRDIRAMIEFYNSNCQENIKK